MSPAQLVEAGHDLRAKAALTALVAAEPTNAEAAWLLSKSLVGLGELDGALAQAERAVALDAENGAYHVQLGAVLGRITEKASMFKQLGLARRTRKELEAGVGLDPKNLDGMYALMLYYYSAPSFMGGDKAKASDLADRIAAVDATQGLMARAALAHEAKDAAAELDYWMRAVASDSGNFEAWAGLTQYHLGRPKPDWTQVEKAGCRLLELDPGRPDGWRALIEAHVACRCWTEVAGMVAASEGFNSDDLSPYYTAATAMIRSEERLDTAHRYLDRYLAQPAEGSEPTHAMARWQLATLLERQQLPDDAVLQLTRALEDDPALEPAKKDLKRLRGK
jgi:tetratricopeptide (TPR) repeat protein